MGQDTHPPRDSTNWDNPDYCAFCGVELEDGGAGFMAHVEESPECHERFEAWLENVGDDIGGEWSG